MRRLGIRVLVVFVLVVAAPTSVFGQATVQNNVGYVAYYSGTRLPASAAREALLAPEGAIDFLGTYLASERYLPPFGGLVDSTLTTGTGSVVGVFVNPGSPRYPVFVVPGNSEFFALGEENIVTMADGSALTVSPLDLRVDAERIVIDNRYLDWETIPDQLRSGPATTPRRARRIVGGREETQDINQTMYWQKGGTELEGLKLALTESSLYLGFDASRPLVEGLSLFVYVFGRQPRSVADMTIEIPVVQPSGPVLLWRRGFDEPVVAGYFAVADFFLEARVFLDEMDLPSVPGEVTLDVSTAFFGSDVYEEFEYGTVRLNSAPMF